MSKSKIFLIGSLIFLSGNFIYGLFFAEPQQHYLQPGFYEFRAKVVGQDKKLNGWNILVQPENLENYQGQILIYAPLYPEYNYGDILELGCKLQAPEPIVNNQGGEFAYDGYLAKDKIYALCFRPSLKVVGQSKDWNFYLFKAKRYFWNNLDIYLVEPSSSLAKALLLADQKEITQATRQNFSRTGISHIIAISGLHIVIIIFLLEKFFLLLGLSRKQSFFVVFLTILTYLALINFVSPAVRSAFMILLVLLGRFLGRPGSATHGLLFSADLLVLGKPTILLYDISFQLSFLAVLGMLLYGKFFERLLFWLPEKLKIREVVAVTLAAQVFTWPLIVYYFGIFSLVAPLANFFILPLLPFILVLGLVLAAVGFCTPLASLVAWPLFILLKIMIETTKFLAHLPWAYLPITYFPMSWLVLSFFFLILLTFIIQPQKYEKNHS